MYTYPDGYKTPFVVKDDELVFPMLILFPEHQQSNIVQNIAESDTFADILYVPLCPPPHPQTILPSAQGHQEYMPWDEEKQYTVSNVEVWFQEFLVLPYPKEGVASDDSLRNHFQKQVGARRAGHAEVHPGQSEFPGLGSAAVSELCDSRNSGVFGVCQECVGAGRGGQR